MSAEATFGSHVRRRREALGLTRKELAHRVGCSMETVRKIESGMRHPSHQIADLLAKHLAVRVTALLIERSGLQREVMGASRWHRANLIGQVLTWQRARAGFGKPGNR